MSSLDEAWARRNWLRSTAFLTVYYVFFTVILVALLLWDFYNCNSAIHQQSVQRLDRERHKLLGTMTNDNKSFIQIITQKQESFNLFKKHLKGVSLALENKDTAKATGLLEIYKTGDSIIDNPETQEVLDQLNNPILASFLSNRILEMQADHIDIAMNISP
ncbi:hypothetical protein [Streptococcus vestibularis]|uniref:Uncharacterized protein n=1 Tax=Streptococcus vestibularis TaxID=1343 RepID=A0A564T683_STRVE|nr:hypothetical protein [Streptococcus vestibularis]VUX02592.1 Uncharacterised protein [Streptococcus vestibularis]